MKSKMKTTSMPIGIKLLAMFLVIATCVVSLPITAFASYFNKDEVQLPDVVQSDTSSAMDYIERLKEQEADLYSFLFGKTDGSIERIIYNYPVKYLNADGIISDKSNEIILETINGISAFVSKANDIKASFPTNLRDGVSLVHEGVNVKMVYAPAGVTISSFSSIGSISNDNYSVSYPIDSKTSIEYALTYNGFKEDIVVSEYTGQTEYSFVLYTDGLAVEKIGENIFLINNEGDICVNIGDVVVFTADERNNFMGTMSFDEIVPNEKYILTIHLDNADLSDPNTAYPIRIDPTLEINYTNNGSGAIEDIVINSADPHSGTETVLKIGKHSDDSSISRALMRFPSLDVEGLNIVSARIELRDIMCESTSMQMDCYEYVGTTWTESAGISWDDISNLSYIGEYQDTQYVFYGNGNVSEGGIHIYSFDITDVAKKWAVGTSDPATGILFKASDTHEATGTYYKSFGSYNRSTYRPVLTIAYVDASGLNPTYSYNSTQLGDNVVLYDNAAFGNMIISHNMTIPTMNEFPLELGLIYNSSFSDSHFFDKYGLASTTYGKFGKGWKPTFVEYVVLEDDRYLYVDGSGAEYYFVYDADHDNFINEALGAELSIDSSSNVTLIIDDIVRVFNTNGLLSSVTSNKKTYTYTYSSGKLTSITSAEGNSISFTYSSNLLSKISYQVTLGTTVYTNSYSFTYSSEGLTAISDVYGNTTTYAITDTSINVYDNLNAYGYYYTLNASGCVTNYKYYRLSTSYVINNVTVNRNIGSVAYSDTYGNTVTKYILDDNNRTVNVIVTNSDGSKTYDMSFTTYDENQLSAYVVNPDKTNLITNSSFETTTGWSGNIVSSSNKALFGNNSAKLSPTSSSQKYISKTATVTAGTAYTFSAYINCDSLNNTESTPQGGVKLSVLNSSGSVIAESKSVCTPINTTNNGWFRISLPFTAISSGTYTFKISTVNSNGDIYVDAVQLEKSESAGTYNALSMSSATVASGSSYTTGAITLNGGNTAHSFILNGSIDPAGTIHAGEVYVTLMFVCGTQTYSVNLPFLGATAEKQYISYEVNIPESYSAPSTVTATIFNKSNYSLTYYNPGLSFGFGSYVAESEYSTGLVYTSNNDGTCRLTGIGTFTGKDVIIPSTNPATGEIVTSISNSVFYNNTTIESVVVPGTVEELSNAVFSSCTSLTSVVLEDGVKTIGGSAFYGCTSLVDVSLPESLTTIETYAFHNCTALTDIYIPDSVTSISTCVFYKCTALENVYLGNGITTIANSTFNECTSLKSITLPDGITSLGAYAFNNCTALRAIGFPKSISSLANGSIYNCSPNLKIYYSGSSAEWNAISQGTNSLPTSCVVVPNTELNGNFAYTYTYDNNGNVSATEISYLGLPDDGSVNADALMFTSAIYDVNGNMTSYTDESGATTTYTYDRYSNVLTVKDAKGVITTYVYDSYGRLSSVSCSGMSNVYTYSNGLLTQVTHTGSNSFTETYYFVYNNYGNLTSVQIGSRTLVSYTYDYSGRGNLLTTQYANGTVETYTYDDMGNQLTKAINGTVKYSWVYDYSGSLCSESDNVNGTTTVYYADEYGYTLFSVVYDANGNDITFVSPEYTITTREETDVYDRKTSETLTTNEAEIIKYFTYQSNGSYSSYLVASESFSDGTTEDSNTFSYTYDAVGNLTSISENGIIKQKFTYDNLSQLIREDNAYIGKSYVYEYDGNGNIIKKNEYAYTTGTLGTATDTIAYEYSDSSWKDLITSYDGTLIDHDALGNPSNWRTFTNLNWTGRQLNSLKLSENTLASYKYNADGLRTKKTITNTENSSTIEYTYVWENGVLAYQSGGGYELYFNYVDGDLVGFTYVESGAETDYYYGKNNLGEIRYIYDDGGNIVVTYTYDAWGTPISVTGSRATSVGQINPIRYKDYYYDTETGLYYLQSRYYDSEFARFINSDDCDYIGKSGEILSFNAYIYCLNNPIMLNDPSGSWYLNFVAAGIQVEIDLGPITYGFEFIATTSGKIYVYQYGGLSISNTIIETIKDCFNQALNKVISNPAALIKIFTDVSMSVSIFAVWRKWNNSFSAQAYTMYFKGYSLTFPTGVYGVGIKQFTSWSSDYLVIGAGAVLGSSQVSIGFSHTCYFDITSKVVSLVNLFKTKIRSLMTSAKRL